MERLGRLFDYLMAHPEQVPGNDSGAVSTHRSVCDYIASMTDRYFLQVYDSLLG